MAAAEVITSFHVPPQANNPSFFLLRVSGNLHLVINFKSSPDPGALVSRPSLVGAQAQAQAQAPHILPLVSDRHNLSAPVGERDHDRSLVDRHPTPGNNLNCVQCLFFFFSCLSLETLNRCWPATWQHFANYRASAVVDERTNVGRCGLHFVVAIFSTPRPPSPYIPF